MFFCVRSGRDLVMCGGECEWGGLSRVGVYMGLYVRILFACGWEGNSAVEKLSVHSEQNEPWSPPSAA